VQSFDNTDAGINVKANGSDASGFAERYSCDVAALDARERAAVAAEKASRSAHPIAVEPGRWTVILEPPAFGELLEYLAEHFSAQAFHEGSSFLSDGLGRPYVGENVTVWDDYAHPLNVGMPFDFEGTPTVRLPLIDRGVGVGIVTDARWAAALERANTGHALPAPNAEGPQARHLVLEPGTASLDELIADTERGLLVSRFWYVRAVDRRATIVTGMTRDGTFLIERGKIVAGVRNLRFNQSILESLRTAEFSRDCARTGGYSYSSVVPAARIRNFTFTSVTEF
jgi:predicted Zn-dependent protease